MDDQRFAPVNGKKLRISWAEHLEAWYAYSSRYGTRQSAERIAQRGGFGLWELEEFLGRAPRTYVDA